LRVAFITHYPDLYGANRSLLNLIDGLKEYDLEPYVICPGRGDLVKALNSRKIPVAIFPLQYWIDIDKEKNNLFGRYYQAARRLRRNFKVLPRIEEQLKEWQIDIIYTNASVTPIGAFAAQRLKLPHVWHLREFIDLDYGFKLDWSKFSLKFFLKQADAIIAISEAIRAYHLKGFSSKKVHVIYNGVNTLSQFDRLHEIRQTAKENNKLYTFALVGLLHPGKGQDTAIKAVASLVKDFPNIRLAIVGGSGKKDYPEYLKQLTEELKVTDKVEFWGYVKDPYTVYLEADAMLMCSQYEAMGRVTAEAMSACLPVIGYDNAGTSELIQHEYAGLLYQNGHQELAACMRRFLENPSWARELGENAWQVARQKYCVEAYAKNVYEVLLSVKKEKDRFKK
jgi:glycosyltransferase involved in cell wall biosynthesis